MTTAIKSIPTRYAGHAFRSRLEARWGVFFDQLHIPWEYERQGYDIDGAPYLPDFWLPRDELHVEVKGDNDTLRAAEPTLRAFVRDASLHRGVLVLGHLPAPSRSVPIHPLLALPGRDLGSDYSAFLCRDGEHHWRWIDINDPRPLTVDPLYMSGLHPHAALADAYEAARIARFEHGQNGAPS